MADLTTIASQLRRLELHLEMHDFWFDALDHQLDVLLRRGKPFDLSKLTAIKDALHQKQTEVAAAVTAANAVPPVPPIT